MVRIERRKYQFLYREGDLLICMDNETYDQINVSKILIGNNVDFIKEGEQLDILFDGTDIVNIEVPIFVQLTVKETEPGFKGDTATGATKPAVLETGATINVPLFINVGDELKVDTRTNSYIERVKL